MFDNLWLAATDEEKEGKWRDAYQEVEGKWRVNTGGQKLNTGLARPFEQAWPWYETTRGTTARLTVTDFGDTRYGEEANCLQFLPYMTGFDNNNVWNEGRCSSEGLACPCQYTQQPILRLRGLQRCSTLDKIFTPKQVARTPKNIILLGQSSSRIQYSDISSQWILTDAASGVTAVSDASKESYVLGKHSWIVSNDVCNKGMPYTTSLKLSGCDPEGYFTCNDGQCVTMEERCDQIPNCRDKFDERDCQLLVVEEGYNKKSPPIVSILGQIGFTKADVNISIALLKIVDMEEPNHKIDLQFQISLEWRENYRLIFQNLKQNTFLNALSQDDVEKIWLPLVIYDNTDQKEMTRLGAQWEWATSVVVSKEGNFSSCTLTPACRELTEINEIEISEGNSNRIIMQQVYTWQFQCFYQLQHYPFDSQVP